MSISKPQLNNVTWNRMLEKITHPHSREPHGYLGIQEVCGKDTAYAVFDSVDALKADGFRKASVEEIYELSREILDKSSQYAVLKTNKIPPQASELSESIAALTSNIAFLRQEKLESVPLLQRILRVFFAGFLGLESLETLKNENHTRIELLQKFQHPREEILIYKTITTDKKQTEFVRKTQKGIL